MKFTFEVKASDLMGRLGVIRVGGKTLETPCLLPVVHPVSQSVPDADLSRMGFKGIMTNSYIIHKRIREEALRRGVHAITGFDGVVMTDSGGYQVLEYGDLDIDYRDSARLQEGIGSDIAVTLDAPTGFTQSKSHARDTMERSLRAAVATMQEFGNSQTVWVGPVQGGLFVDLLRKSAKALLAGGFEFLALGSPTQVMEGYHFTVLARMITAARKAMPYPVPLHLFGAGHPLTIPVSVALGSDTFDSASYILFARRGSYMTERGVVALKSMQYLPCSCEVCSKSTVKDLLEMTESERVDSLARHNLMLLKKEVDTCKEAIVEGRLWDLVRERAQTHPMLHGALAEIAGERLMLADGTPAFKDRGLFVTDENDLARPELELARRRLSSSVRRRSGKAILLDSGGAHGPVPRRRFRSSSADVYVTNPVIGPYPVELEFVYPFTQTVIGLEAGGKRPKEAVKYLKRLGYSSVTVRKERKRAVAKTSRVRSRQTK